MINGKDWLIRILGVMVFLLIASLLYFEYILMYHLVVAPIPLVLVVIWGVISFLILWIIDYYVILIGSMFGLACIFNSWGVK